MAQIDAERLRRTGWLATTPPGFQDAVLEPCDPLQVAAGAPIYFAGDSAGGIYGVARGRIELHLPSPGDGPTLVHIAGPGFWVGDLAALRGHPRRFSIVARTRSSLLRLPRAEMLRLGADDPACWQWFAGLAAANLSLAVDVIEALRHRHPVSRVAAALLILADGSGGSGSVAYASQSDIGAMMRLSRGVVSATLKQLEARGWIKRRYAATDVTDLLALASFARQPTIP